MVVVAATAEGNYALIVGGLSISIPIVIICSTFVVHIVERFPVFVTIRAAFVGWIAGKTLSGDQGK